MKPAVSSWCRHADYHAGRFSVVDAPAWAAEMGVSWVELNDFMLPPARFSRPRNLVRRLAGLKPDPLGPRYSRRVLNRVRRELDTAGVGCAAWTVDLDLTVDDLGWWRQQQRFGWGLDAAQRVGASMLRVTLGGTADMPVERDDMVRQRLRALAQTAAATDVRLAVENHGGISTDIGRFLRLVPDRLSNVGVCFDSGNVRPADRSFAWPLLAERAIHAHLKISGDAAVDAEQVPAVTAVLRRENFRGFVVIEYEGAQVEKELPGWIERITAELR